MPEQVSPSGDDWASPMPGRGAPPPGPGSPAWPGPPATGGAKPAWATPSWNPPHARGSGSAEKGWGSPASGQAAGSFTVGSTAGGQLGEPPDVNLGSTSAGAGPVNPPIAILLVGLALPLASIALLFVDGLAAHVIGWLIAIFGSIGALAAFTALDLRRRSSGWYVDRPGVLAGLRVAVLLTGLVVATCFAYLIADAVARWDVWF